MAKVYLYDTTLRDGAQQEGISLSLDDKLKITKKLDEADIFERNSHQACTVTGMSAMTTDHHSEVNITGPTLTTDITVRL